MTKRILSILIALTFIIFVFAGCKSESVDSSKEAETTKSLLDTLPDTTVSVSENVSDTTTQTTEPTLNEDLVIFEGNTVNYSIVVSLYADRYESAAASALNAAFAKQVPVWGFGRIGNDLIQGQKRGETYSVEGPEILVGLTNRIESHEAYATLENDQFVVKVIGEKLVIVGYDSYATADGVDYFINNFILGGTSEMLSVSGDFEYVGVSDIRDIPLASEATYRIMTYNLGCMVGDGFENNCIDIITRYFPDVMGLQECNAAVHQKVLSKLPEVYAFAKEYHNNSKTVNYTPILYNTELLTCLDADVTWLRGRYTGTNTKSISWAVFKDKDGNKFALINYHGAVCNNSYAGFESYTKEQLNAQALEWKIDNVVQVIEIKTAILEKYGNIPVMVSGDNNFNSKSQPYKDIINAGFCDAETTARVSKMTGYATSYTYGNTPGTGNSIDHVFAIGGIDFVAHSIIRDDDVWKASDHCPVYVDFNIK